MPPVAIRLDPPAADAMVEPAAHATATEEPRSWQPADMPALGATPRPALSNAVRSALLIAFGALLGWSASSVMHFYDQSPVSTQGPPDAAAETALPVERRSLTMPRAAGSDASPSPPAAPPPAIPLLALLGGQQVPDDPLLFCSILVVNPSGCGLEARLRIAQPTPETTPLAPSTPVPLPASAKRPREQRRGPLREPVTSSAGGPTASFLDLETDTSAAP